jgi:hypothetical protein
MLTQASMDADPRIKEAASAAMAAVTRGSQIQQAAYTK